MTVHDHRTPGPGTTHLVMPDSVGTWFHHFTRLKPADRVIALGESAPLTASDLAAEPRSGHPGNLLVFHSSHDTLLRDRALADELTALGVRTLCQSAAASVLALDKVLMKEFFDEHGVPTLPWIQTGGRPGWTGPAVVKSRTGTQSAGMTLRHDCGPGGPGPDEYWEQYADGIEYSVVVYRDAAGWATLPPVWKGATSSELVPPWRRLLMSPYFAPDDALEGRLRDLAVRIAELVDCRGHMEVEYLVEHDGRIRVLEINPRVAGTMRIAAMAADVPIFSLCDLAATRGHLPAVRHAAEQPYQGTPFADPELGVFATSRLTVSAESLGEAVDRLHRLCGHVLAEQPALATA